MNYPIRGMFSLLILAALFFLSCAQTKVMPGNKQHSTFYGSTIRQQIIENSENLEWVSEIQQETIEQADYWKNQSDDELWSFMFGPAISRSWMVWSSGYCPACGKDARMYAWETDPVVYPWKVKCPHCQQLFPTNDFEAYHRSGLAENGFFDPARADRSLLFNTEHPDPADPLHLFGVDDGEGYVADGNRWRFIGGYLIYGQWKKRILAGINMLSNAYMVTGDPIYAHKAAIMLDRIADIHPEFNFGTQAYTYEGQDSTRHHGYVSVWHDACSETRDLAMAYDRIFDGIKQDTSLVSFLAQKAGKYEMPNPKTSFAEIQYNIEQRLLLEPLENRYKITSNFPQTEITEALILTILGWPEQQKIVTGIVDKMLTAATAKDGLSGERGLAGYSALSPRSLIQFLALYDRLEDDFLANLFKRIPNVKQMYRFHIDTWFNEEYYPKVGDTGQPAAKKTDFAGAIFTKNPMEAAGRNYSLISKFSFFWRLYELTGDADYVKLLYRANDDTVGGLPFDLLESNPKKFQQQVQAVIDTQGASIQTKSSNKSDWGLALLKRGNGTAVRGTYLAYAMGGNHCQADVLNMGLYAKGIDLLPGFGYPAVQYGGWHSPKANWYRHTASHNTVLVDGISQVQGIDAPENEPMAIQLNPLKRFKPGETKFWAIGKSMQAIRAAAPKMAAWPEVAQFDRTLLMVDLSPNDSYVVDVQRVVGGKEQLQFFHGHPGKLTLPNVTLKPFTGYEFPHQMSHFQKAADLPAHWYAEWEITDFKNYLPAGEKVFLRYWNANSDIAAVTAESWLASGYRGGEMWLPSLILERSNPTADLNTVFAGVLEPHSGNSKIKSVERLELENNTDSLSIVLKITLKNGGTDWIISQNSRPAEPCRISGIPIQTDAELCCYRQNPDGTPGQLMLVNGSQFNSGDTRLTLEKDTTRTECQYQNGAWQPVTQTKK